MKIKSLEQRLVLFLLLPVACLLFLTGFLGFLYARSIMLREWGDAAVLRLERAAHHLDMRLSGPESWIRMFNETGGHGGAIVQEWLVQRLRGAPGVTAVDLQWSQAPAGGASEEMRGMGMRMGMGMGAGMAYGMHFHMGRISEVTSPQIDARTGKETVDLISELKNEEGKVVGRLRVSVSFDYLMQDILKLGWWQSNQACLVDASGHYLAHTAELAGRSRLAENGDPVEAAILQEMKVKPFGTVLGAGHPPKVVGGFFKIADAPWAVVMIAPGDKILGPIIKFRLYYFAAGALCILIILLLIRLIGGRMVRSIKELSAAAERITGGSYGEPLQAKTSDEMGHLIRSFNKMVEGLKERDFISNTFGRYVDHEIAKEILKKPQAGRIGGEKRVVSILFSDIRGFTPIADSLKPEGTIRVLNLYFARMIEHVHKHKGIIVDFFGDGLLAFFDPLEGPVLPALRSAVRCALDMQSAMRALNAETRTHSLPELRMGIGVNAGEVVVGNIGSEHRAKYGIVGSAVNITERIQSIAKGGEVVISQSVLSPLSGEIRVRRSFTSMLKGIDGETKLFVVEDLLSPLAENRVAEAWGV